jgi:hypothetical protein
MGLTDRVFGAKRELPSSRSSESLSDPLRARISSVGIGGLQRRRIGSWRRRESPVRLTEQRSPGGVPCAMSRTR